MGVSVREKIKGKGWWIFIAHNKKRASRKVGTRAAANKVARELRAKLAVADFLPEKRDIPTVKERWEHFEKNYLSLKSDSKAANYRTNFNTHILPVFGSTRMDAVTDETVESFIADLVNGKKLAKQTIATILREGGRLYTHAKKIVGNFNPFAGHSGLYTNAKQAEEIRPFNREESELFLRTAREHEPEDYCIFLTMLHSGIRPGELAGLQWADVDWFNKSLFVQRAIDLKHRKIVPTKSRKSRSVKISDELIAALKEHRAAQRAYWFKKGTEMPEWVFPNDDGGWQDMNNLRERAFARTLIKAGLASRDLYDLRHTYASQLLKDGAPPTFVQKQMGHATLDVTLRVYAHYLPDEGDRQFINRLPSLSANAPVGPMTLNASTVAAD
jgi:integrase